MEGCGGGGWGVCFFSSRRRHTRLRRDWSSDVCSSDLNNNHKKRLLMKPGITGISQIKYRSELMTEESLNSEIEYLTNNNLLIDFKIIIMTIFSVFKKKGVYEK